MDAYLIAVISLLVSIVAFLFVWRMDTQITKDLRIIEALDGRITKVEEQQAFLFEHFKKVLVPIRQAAEMVEDLDDEIYRVDSRIDDLRDELRAKKQEA